MSHFLCNILHQDKRKNNAEIQENRLGLSWILYTIYLFHQCQRIQNHLLRLLIFAFPLHCKPMITVKKSFCVNLLLILCAFTEIFLCSRFIPYSFPSCFFRYRTASALPILAASPRFSVSSGNSQSLYPPRSSSKYSASGQPSRRSSCIT